jgi:predicted PurR-regulated permease PerM
MTPRQATAMFLVTIGLCLLITLGAVRSLNTTRQEHQQLTRQLQTTIDQDGADPLKLLEEVIEETNPPVLVKYAKESDSATGNADLDFPLDDIEVLEKDSIDLEDDGPINADDSL